MKTFLLIFSLVLSFKATVAQWEPDYRITYTSDSSILGTGKSHCIAASSDTVHIIWFEKAYDLWNIFYKQSINNGTNWGPDVQLTFTSDISMYPSLCLESSKIYVVWRETVYDNMEICFLRSLDGGNTWDEPIRLTEDAEASYAAAIASRGPSVHMTWVSQDTVKDTWTVRYMRSLDDGSTWGSDVVISAGSTMAYNPTIELNGTEIYIAWNDNRDGNFEIYYRYSTDEGLSWSPETRLTYTNDHSFAPSLAVSGTYIYVAWMEMSGGFFRVNTKGSLDAGMTWSEDVVATPLFSHAMFPNLCLSNSTLHLVWQDQRSGHYDVYYNYSIPGWNCWFQETRLNEVSISSEHPFLAISGPAIHTIWSDYRDTNFEIYYKRNPTGNLIGSVPSYDLNSRIYPNPSAGLFRIEFQNKNFTCGTIQIVNLTGQVILYRAIKNILNNNSFQVDISSAPDGIYFIRIDNGGEIESYKIIKRDMNSL